MLENLRVDPGEKAGDKIFALALSKFGDIYVNEAFPVSHREDASIVLLPKLLPSYVGFQFEKEVKELSKILKPKHPFLFIQGGVKAETKIPLLKRYLKEADVVFIGGGLADDFLRAKGIDVGKSKVDSEAPLLKVLLKNKKLILPESVVVERDGKKQTISIHDIRHTESIFDIGLPSIDALATLIKKSKLIVWNGPMGWYEGGYTQGTEEVIKLLASAKGETIIGGGDTAVLVEKKKMADKFTFVSTAGGAALEFMAKGTLPGIKALK
jgi:phosphoglycerate kinase